MKKDAHITLVLDLEKTLLASLARPLEAVSETATLASVAAFSVTAAIEFCKIQVTPGISIAAKHLTPSLRPMCEQLITIDYLSGQPASTVQELLKLLLYRDISRLVSGQNAFFERRRPLQPLAKLDSGRLFDTSARQRLEVLGRRLTPSSAKGLPPTEQMARVCGYVDLYDHIFRMTSKTVHFRPWTCFSPPGVTMRTCAIRPPVSTTTIGW